MKKFAIRTIVATGLLAGGLGLGTTATSAMPMLNGTIASRAEVSPKAEQARFVCRYRHCYRHYGYYRPYRYGYYRPYYHPYYYGPHIGIGLGGIGLGIY